MTRSVEPVLDTTSVLVSGASGSRVPKFTVVGLTVTTGVAPNPVSWRTEAGSNCWTMAFGGFGLRSTRGYPFLPTASCRAALRTPGTVGLKRILVVHDSGAPSIG